MAFSKTLSDRYIVGKGMVEEVYEWNGAAVTTSGAQSADATDAEGIGKITTLTSVIVTDDQGNATTQALSADRDQVTFTFTSNDTGTLVLRGKAK